MYPNIPVNNPRPDKDEFLNIILGKTSSKRVPLIEYIIDDVVGKPIITDLLGRKWVEPGSDRESQKAYFDNFIQIWYRMGYDFVRFEENMGFTFETFDTEDASVFTDKDRSWANEGEGVIKNWEDFEKYPWPKIEEFDFFPFEYINNNLPEGMGLIACHAAGIFEHISWILSLTGLSLLLYDDPDLIKAVADKTGSLILDFYRHLLDLDNLIVIFQGDDMGFRSGTLISPDDLRKYSLSWHKKFAALTHEKGRPYFLHSCGNLHEIMEDLIEDVKIDAKHSYEDVIKPVDEFQEIYGNRIGILGGLDLNILSGETPEKVREKTRYLLETCGPGGRYAIGSGNSIPSYVPVENYLTMIDEVSKYNNR